MTAQLRKLCLIVLMLAMLLALPSIALAHDGMEAEPLAIAGPLSWVFLIFAILVIVVVAAILFARRSGEAAPGAITQTGLRGYTARMRAFSRNARLYMIHVVGMDVIYGTWEVVFNLYLLAVGFDVAFIGLRILLRSISFAVMSIPAGVISDRIGRKLSFILGDGMGALMALVAISTTNPTLILAAAVTGGLFGSLHGVSEPAFMAENSRDDERVHLFSVASGTRTAAAIIGSALAGLASVIFAVQADAVSVGTYRLVAYGGIAIWFGSLIPAILLRQTISSAPVASLRQFFANIEHPGRIFRLVLPAALIGLGAGFVIPLMNVYFKEGLGSTDLEIGATFSAGQALLVVAAFLAPLLAARLGKIRAIVFSQLVSLPFIILLAFAPEIGGALGSVLAVAGLAYMLRITTMDAVWPVRSAFAMEILAPGERGTQVGIENALESALAGIAAFFGARFMNAGDFRTPFLIMAGLYLAATLTFWAFFREKETALRLAPEAETAAAR